MEGGERQADDEQLVVLRRLRAVFGHVEVIAIHVDTVGSDGTPEDDHDVGKERHERPAQDDPGGAD
jgi:hypothetical protein